ncbi:hypothetical protein [Microbacterium lushaniae]|uniref:Uncharacterized protein n=1 Tax=Microbacterium lushaniae TaxID=2614639 RepID=A0A5J6L0I9_9MICO|nr:hypothetical protein [Microbacterium lushaniae]QEW02008.1 hypothetical protein F6J85_02100 [Microbacterium lushaniae]
MLVAEFPRDLVTIGVVFGLAAIVWAGWGQERPPSRGWRIPLGVLSVAGLALVGFGIPAAIRTWDTGTAIEPGTPAFVGYVVAFWLEVVIAVVGALVLRRRRQSELLPALILLIVGVHFFPLALVFGQGVLALAAVLLVVAAVLAYLLRRRAAPSFWCAILGAPVFVILGLWCLLGGIAAA